MSSDSGDFEDNQGSRCLLINVESCTLKIKCVLFQQSHFEHESIYSRFEDIQDMGWCFVVFGKQQSRENIA
jgi:hypothetical protein